MTRATGDTSMRWRPSCGARKTSREKFLGPFEGRRSKQGRDKRTLLEDLAGEAAQNTLDLSRADTDKPVELEFELATVTGDVWKELSGPSPRSSKVLRISNRNVAGLDGAYGNKLPDGSYQKFFDFGADSEKSAGGGSHGYGRSTYFLVSASWRLLVDSVYVDSAGVARRRLVGVRLLTSKETKAYAKKSSGGYRCDGLEVWGPCEAADGVGEVIPLDEPASDQHGEIAKLVESMRLHRAAGDCTPGTDFYVLDPLKNEELTDIISNDAITDKIVLQHLEGALFWRLWPALQDGKIVASVVDGGNKRVVRADETDPSLWPLFAFACLRGRLSGDASALKNYGGTDYADCEIRGVRAGAYKFSPHRSAVVHPALVRAYPGNVFSGEKNIASVVRFRDNGLVVNYDSKLQVKGEEFELKVPDDENGLWHIGLLEVLDPDLSELIRAGERDPDDKVLLAKVEDVSHTCWSFSAQMRKFEGIAAASTKIAGHLGRTVSGGVQNAETGSAFWTRSLGNIFKSQVGAPGDADEDGRTGPGSGEPSTGRGLGFAAKDPELVNKEPCYVFEPPTQMSEDAAYVLTVTIESLAGNDKYPEPKGYVLDESNSSPAPLDLANYKYQPGSRVAVVAPADATAISVSAKKVKTL